MLLNFFSLAPTTRLNKLECWLMASFFKTAQSSLFSLIVSHHDKNFFSLPLTTRNNKLECLLMSSFLKTVQYWLIRKSVLGLALLTNIRLGRTNSGAYFRSLSVVMTKSFFYFTTVNVIKLFLLATNNKA
jgi:hypothetical protein